MSYPQPGRSSSGIWICAHLLYSVNSNNDRETDGYTALDYVDSIVRTLNGSNRSKKASSSRGFSVSGRPKREYDPARLISHVVYLESGKVHVELDRLKVNRLVL